SDDDYHLPETNKMSGVVLIIVGALVSGMTIGIALTIFWVSFSTAVLLLGVSLLRHFDDHPVWLVMFLSVYTLFWAILFGLQADRVFYYFWRGPSERDTLGILAGLFAVFFPLVLPVLMGLIAPLVIITRRLLFLLV